MLTDDRDNIRELAVRRVLAAREKLKLVEIRKCSPPSLNFDATDYADLINWDECAITSPPILDSVETISLKKMPEEGKIPKSWDFEAFPCHT